MRILFGLSDRERLLWILVSSWVVIGSLILGFCAVLKRALLIPTKTLFNLGSEEWSRGSGSPNVICKFRSADKYTFTVLGAKP